MHKTARLFSTIALMLAMVSCYEVPNDEPRAEDAAMALDTNFIPQNPDPNSLVPGDPASKVYEVKAGTPTNKNDADFNNTVIERQIFTLADEKVDRAGDTMTGLLTIAPSGTTGALVATAGIGSGQPAITAQGDANFPGIVTVSNGSGIVSFGKVEIVGNAGTNALDVAPGTAPSATVPQIGMAHQGLIRLFGTSPNANVNPGFDGTVGRQNVITSSATLTSDGVGGFTVVNNVGFNVASWSGNASGIATVTFARALPGNGYRRHLDVYDGFDARPNGVQNTTNYQFVVRSQATNATIDLTTTAVTIEVSTVGY